MTPAERAALSADLARALGYYPESVRVTGRAWYGPHCEVYRNHLIRSDDSLLAVWVPFDYSAPDVCLPLIEWLTMRNVPLTVAKRMGWCIWSDNSIGICGDTLPEAVARAVIALKTT